MSEINLRSGYEESFVTHHPGEAGQWGEYVKDTSPWEFRVVWIGTRDEDGMEEKLAKRWALGSLLSLWCRRPNTHVVLVYPYREES